MATEQSSRISVIRFTITYIALMIVFFALMYLKIIVNVIDLNGVYSEGVVFVTTKVLQTLGVHCQYRGSVIQLPEIALDVKFGCNGLEAVVLYTVAVMSYPSGWGNKLTWMALGFMIIQALNIVRIAALAFTAVHFKSLFGYIHLYIAQGIMIAVSLAVFFVYVHYAMRQPSEKHAPS